LEGFGGGLEKREELPLNERTKEGLGKSTQREMREETIGESFQEKEYSKKLFGKK
jgi:hypothetical protein